MTRSFVHQLRVRYGECDPQGVVFNAHYFAYFDIALTELWREAVPGGYSGMTDSGVDMVVAEARARYLTPARFDDVVSLVVEVSRVGTTGMTTTIRVRRDEAVLVEGEMRHVFVDLGTHAKTPIPEPVRAALSQYVRHDGGNVAP
jgi:acyl-CoA thioester hydrolase